MKKVVSGLVAGALAMGIFASSAFAEVSFDSSTGTGFVGKGDVQTVLGLNNAELQKKADSLEFTYETIKTYEVTVQWTTGEGKKGEKVHTVDHKKTINVNDVVGYDSKTKKQVVGFNLEGFTSSTESENITIGDIYPANSGHVVVDVVPVSTTSTLFVNGVALQ